MAKKGGRTTVKRQLAPTFWDINRKEGRFIQRIHPGSHSQKHAYPLGTILRDVLKVAKTMHEAKKIVDGGKVKVDNVLRYNINFAVGLMDTIELIPSKQSYRFVPKNSLLLHPIEITEEEKAIKLVKIKTKNIVKGNKIQYTFHDGKTGKIQEIKEGTFSLPKRVVILVESRILEIPIDAIMVISESNENNPKIKVS